MRVGDEVVLDGHFRAKLVQHEWVPGYDGNGDWFLWLLDPNPSKHIKADGWGNWYREERLRKLSVLELVAEAAVEDPRGAYEHGAGEPQQA